MLRKEKTGYSWAGGLELNISGKALVTEGKKNKLSGYIRMVILGWLYIYIYIYIYIC